VTNNYKKSLRIKQLSIQMLLFTG